MRKVPVGCLLACAIGLLAASADAREVAGSPSAEEADRSRVRAGFSINGGFGTGGGASGETYGPALHLGWQFDRVIAVYLRAAGFWWSSSTKLSADRSLSATGAIGFQLTPLFSLTHAGTFEVAAGPSLDRLQTAGSSSNASSRTTTLGGDAVAYSGVFFGAHGRAALHVGAKPSSDTGRRTSFTIGLDVHPTFAKGSALTFLTVGVGVDWY